MDPLKSVHISSGRCLSRRAVLRGAGVALGLPFLEAMRPAFAAGAAKAAPKRFIGVSLSLGLHGPNLVPEGEGRNYKPSRYLKSLQDIREEFTVISGSSHPRVTGGHSAEGSIFSACPNQRGATTRNTISLDQLLAKHLGHETRFPSLVLNTGNEKSPSYTENGAMIPAETSPRKLFQKLFIEESAGAKRRQRELLRGGQSVLDIVGAEARALQREVGAGDREKLDAWFTSVRELEQRLEAGEEWVDRPKPKVGPIPADPDRNNAADQERAMLDILFLALQTDSTRFATLHCTGNSVRAIEGVDDSYHSLSHHGRDEEKLAQLALVEQAMIDAWGNFLRQLKGSEQGGHSLLDDTMVLLTSNLGNASAHDNKNMPVLFAGGGFRHGQHLAFDRKNNYPLPNLFLSALHQAGLQDESFATSTGEMDGLVARG
ncbi:MAG: DUF1552 domain-containing protein [Akkermansiaceae bacterium]|nr:DUF1552 domain-containing protein [Akkermansiaceae bacterium]NNM28246.1 DUF1552 domain-containing protein [Akkermansiaceae bacterium]